MKLPDSVSRENWNVLARSDMEDQDELEYLTGKFVVCE